MEKTAKSRLSLHGRVVIPKSVRERLHLEAGDVILYRLVDDLVTIAKAREDGFDPFSSFNEWQSEEDEVLYRTLGR